MMDKLTVSEWFFNALIWVIFLFLNRYQLYLKSNKGTGFAFFFIVVTIFSTYGFTSGDYFHYKGLYDQLVLSPTNVHVEEFYFWLIKNLPESYTLWRFVVWGIAAIVFVLISRRLKINSRFLSLIFALLLMIYFPNPRNTLAYVVFYWGITFFFFKWRNAFVSFLLGLIFVLCSYYLHKSMFVYIGLFVIVLLIRWNKWIYIGSLILFPFLYKSLSSLAEYFLIYSFANEESLESGIRYLESDFYQIANLNGLIQLALNRIPVIVLMIYSIYYIYFRNHNVESIFRLFLNYTYVLMYISFLFYGQQVSAFLSPRFWDASMYTATLFLSYYLYMQNRTFLIKGALCILVLANVYNLAYILYKL